MAALHEGLVSRGLRTVDSRPDDLAARRPAVDPGPHQAARGAARGRQMTPFLHVELCTKHYGAIRAVDGVSFSVGPGEIVGVIEPSRSGVGRTFQTLQVFGKLSVRDNLIVASQEFRGTLPGRLFAAPDAGLGRHADEMIELFRLQHVARLPAGSLSYGEQKLIDIAMAFMPAPRLVLLDEPCAGVNPAMVEQLRELLLELNRAQGGSFIVIEHNMDFIMRLCPRVICMVEGKVLAEGPPREVQSNRRVLDAYLGN